ncbi:MAG: hypothetical protein GY720_11350 [bacterium]|nr:hypothetical protein [bacterium]
MVGATEVVVGATVVVVGAAVVVVLEFAFCDASDVVEIAVVSGGSVVAAVDELDVDVAAVKGVVVGADVVAVGSSWATVSAVARKGDGRLVTSSRTLPTAEVASAMEASVATNQPSTGPSFFLIVE